MPGKYLFLPCLSFIVATHSNIFIFFLAITFPLRHTKFGRTIIIYQKGPSKLILKVLPLGTG